MKSTYALSCTILEIQRMMRMMVMITIMITIMIVIEEEEKAEYC